MEFTIMYIYFKNRSSGPELIWYFDKEANGLIAQLIYSGTIKSS